MIDDVMVGNSIDMVAAFVGDECRGVANGLFFPPLGVHQFNVLAYSNQSLEKCYLLNFMTLWLMR